MVTCTVRDQTGAVISECVHGDDGSTAARGVGALGDYLFPALTGMRGTVDCVSTTNIAATALRFIGANAFSSLPVINK